MEYNKLTMSLTLKPPEKRGDIATLCIEVRGLDLAQIPQKQFQEMFSQELDKIWPQIEKLQIKTVP